MKQFDAASFQEEVLNNRFYSLVLFMTDWHEQSKSMIERLKLIQTKNDKVLVIGYIDVTLYPEVTKETNLKTLPHFILYGSNGKIMSEFTELYSEWDLKVYMGDALYNMLIKPK